jgi:hypothetical protein
MPISAGGKATLDNLALACPACNRYKGNRQLVKDPGTSRLVAMFNPRLQSWRDHFRWSEDLEVIIGVTLTGRVTVEQLRMNRPSVRHFRMALKASGLHPALEDRSV